MKGDASIKFSSKPSRRLNCWNVLKISTIRVPRPGPNSKRESLCFPLEFSDCKSFD